MVLLAGTTADEMKSRGQGDSHSGEIHIACKVGGDNYIRAAVINSCTSAVSLLQEVLTI